MPILDKIQLQKAATFKLGVSNISENQVQAAFWRQGVSRCQLCLYKHGKKQKIMMEPMRAHGIPDI